MADIAKIELKKVVVRAGDCVHIKSSTNPKTLVNEQPDLCKHIGCDGRKDNAKLRICYEPILEEDLKREG